MYIKYAVICAVVINIVVFSFAESQTPPPALLEEFDRINHSIDQMRKDIAESRDDTEKRIQGMEGNVKDLTAKLETLEKDFSEFRQWVEKKEDERSAREKMMDEGVEIKGKIISPSNRYTTR